MATCRSSVNECHPNHTLFAENQHLKHRVAHLEVTVGHLEYDEKQLMYENERIANSHARLMNLLAELLGSHSLDNQDYWHRRAMNVMGADLYAALGDYEDCKEVPHQ